MDGGSDAVANFAASDACVCVGVPPDVGVLCAVYVEELFTGVDVCDCEGRESWSLVGDAAIVVVVLVGVVVADSGGGGDEDVTTSGGEEVVDVEFAAWGVAAALEPFIVREAPDTALEDEALECDGDAAAPKANMGRAGEEDNPPDAFDFPLSVEWWKYKFSTSFRDCRCWNTVCVCV
jgi:hypothetical protein